MLERSKIDPIPNDAMPNDNKICAKYDGMSFWTISFKRY
ncbi:hypothetical protein EV06_1200 [Prochlorococcus sp. MIT 0602]|nr:hypothetical protein EV06_1200 [Prochlorococcus sp. MIT 0602]KGG17607.1 hypothetical protein EV07_1047 [Prochlorococcus sp. MIT 0603]